MSQFLDGTTGIPRMIWDSDAAIVDALIDDPPGLLTAYELGKALSLTSWCIADAGDDSTRVVQAWKDSFNEGRIDNIRRHLTTLAPALDRLDTQGGRQPMISRKRSRSCHAAASKVSG